MMMSSSIKENLIDVKTFITRDFLFQHYQPIVDLAINQIYGYESLMRCKIEMNPLVLFQTAKRQELLYELDTYCISKSVHSYFLPEDPMGRLSLFVNIYPSTLLNPALEPLLEMLAEQVQDSPSSLVFEINEAMEENGLWESGGLKRAVSSIRKFGFRLAMDDVGEGAASLKHIIEYAPDIIKLSRHFALNLSKDKRKQRLVKMLADYCGNETMLILEGIETCEDLACARDAGVSFGQGYYLGRPQILIKRAAQ